jgi:hypothetical protein
MDLIALLLAVMVAVSALAFGWNAYVNWRFQTGVRRAARIQSVDVSAAGREPPAAIQPLHAALLVRGFRRLGEVGVHLPGRAPYPMWVLVNPEERVHVELAVVRDRGYAAFVTWFADDAVVETHYPAGAAVDEPDFRAQVVRESLETALKRHLSAVGAFTRAHGEPVAVDDMAAFLTYSRRYNEHFLPRKLETMRPDAAAPTFANVYGLLVLAAGLAARLVFRVPDFPLLAGMFALLTPAILYDVYHMVRRRRSK